MISEQLRVTLLSLKQISDRLKLLNTTSVTKSEALAYKNEIIAALEDIDFTEITEALDSIDEKIGTAPVGSDKATIFAWLTSLYDYVVGQDPEEIPEGLGDRINLLLQFFGLPQALPLYSSASESEVKAMNDDVFAAIYGYGNVVVTIHALIRVPVEEDLSDSSDSDDYTEQDLECVVYVNPNTTWASNGYPILYTAQGVAVDTTTNPAEGDVVYLYQQS